MAYEKQNFAAGQILTAAQMNHIEEGIEQAEKSMPTALPSPNSIRFLNKTDGAAAAEYDGSEAVAVELIDDAHIESVVKPIITWENVLNKPFGQVGYAGMVLDGYQITLDDSGQGIIDRPFYLKEKVNYTVAYTVNNNTRYYECTGIVYAVDGVNMVWVGNLTPMTGVEMGNLDAPFLMACVPEDMVETVGAYGTLFDFEGNSAAIVSVAAQDTFAPLDEELIPDTIARLSQVEAMIDAKIAELKGST